MATTLTANGRGVWCGMMAQTLSTPLRYIGWGTGSGTASTSSTGLFTEDTTGGYVRATGTMSLVTTTTTNDTFQVVGTLTAGATLTITNAGTFTASTAGTIGVHGDFTGIALASGDAITFTIKTQLT